MWIKWPALLTGYLRPMVPLRMRSAVASDESHSRHFDLIGGGGHPWSIDLVYVTASAILVVGFGCALVAHVVR